VSTSRRARAAAVYALIGATSLVLWPSLATLVQNWRAMTSYDHGFLVAAAALFLLARSASDLAVKPWRPSVLASVALAVVLLAWVVSYRSHSDLLIQLFFPAAVVLTVCAAAGVSPARVVVGPITLLYVAIPVWDLLVPTLQALTTTVAGGVLDVLGVPVLVDGNRIMIPAGEFIVVADCAGKRYLLVSMAIGALLAINNELRGWRTIALAAVAVAAALVTNWLRVFAIIYAGHLSDMQNYLVANEHVSFGYVLFSIPVGVLLVAARRWSSPPLVRHSAGLPTPSNEAKPIGRRWQDGATAALPVALLACSALLLRAGNHDDIGARGVCLASLPASVENWRKAEPETAWRPQFVSATDSRRGAYESSRGRVEVYINYYARQARGSELVGFGNSVIGPNEWQRDMPRELATLRPRFLGAEARYFEVRAPDGQRWLIAYRYQVGRVRTAFDGIAQLAYGAGSIGGPAPSAIVALATRCESQCESAVDRVSHLWRSLAVPSEFPLVRESSC